MTDEEAISPRVRIERPSARVARIVLSRPDRHNAQDLRMLWELDDAYSATMADGEVKVVILGADGRHFSSGHDLGERFELEPDASRIGWGGFGCAGVEGWWATERELFVQTCLRWRDLPKPTIAEVHGRVIAAGLMLMWPCDLIVAAEDTVFSDPVVAFGVNGHEYFVHHIELGARRAKEMLFAGSEIDAVTAEKAGMVNRVVPLSQLQASTLALAERIALRPSMGLKLAKQSVNQALDAAGFRVAVDAAFSLHELGHAHNLAVHGRLIDPIGVRLSREDRAQTSD